MVIKLTSQITRPAVQKEDAFASILGHIGAWQILVCSTVSLVKLSSGWVQMAVLFLTPKLTFRCGEFSNSSAIGENSTCYSGCLRYEYDTSPFENTIVSEWDLVCGRSWLASFTQMMLQLGVLLGSILFGFLSDRYGRKNTFLTSISSLIVLGFAIPFSPDYVTFTVLRFFLGMATAGTMVVSFVLVMETAGPNYREILGCLFQIPFIVGHMTVPLFAYFFRSWDTYSLALAVPSLIYLGYFFLLSESPRWLVSVGRVEEATKIVKRACEMNKRPTTKVEESLTKMAQSMQTSVDGPKLNYTALFHKSLRLKTLCCCAMWMISGLTFFGFNQYISQTSPDPFVSVAAAGAIQIPSNLLSIWLIKNFGRKITTALFFALGGICVVALGVVPDKFWLTLTLGTLGVSCAAIVAAAIYIFTSELFPTVVRNMAMGSSSMSMRVGSMVAPFISNLSLTVPWLPTLIFGFAPIAAGLVCLLLPETKGTTLPDSIEDD
ncbi:unnamed protein product, partial [Iphiclides podalirius]